MARSAGTTSILPLLHVSTVWIFSGREMSKCSKMSKRFFDWLEKKTNDARLH